MGSAAAQMLGELIEGAAAAQSNRVELSTELIVRESTAPAGQDRISLPRQSR